MYHRYRLYRLSCLYCLYCFATSRSSRCAPYCLYRLYCLVFIALLALSPPLAAAGETGAPSLLLANIYRDDIDLGQYWVSEKLDGVRAYWDGETLTSRNGNRFNAPPWFIEDFPHVPLDGELVDGARHLRAVVRDGPATDPR